MGAPELDSTNYFTSVRGTAFVALLFLRVGEKEDRHYRKGAP